MQNQCNLNVRSKCILNALRIRKGNEVLTRKVLINTVITKFEHTKLGIIEYNYTYMDGNVKVD